MIKLLFLDQAATGEMIPTIFADTKSEVPATGSDTQVEGLLLTTLPVGSLIITAKKETAFLDSTDNWEWGDE